MTRRTLNAAYSLYGTVVINIPLRELSAREKSAQGILHTSSLAATSPTLDAAAKCVWMMRKHGLVIPRPTARDRFPAPASTIKLAGEKAVAISSARPTVRNASATMRQRLGSSSNTLPSLPPTCNAHHGWYRFYKSPFALFHGSPAWLMGPI